MFSIAKQNDSLVNEQINYPEVMVIGPNGEKLGMKSIADARTLTSVAGLDLVLLSANPTPVCKIMDYNKYKYEKTKKEKEQKKRQRGLNLELKEYRLSVTIDVHDFDTKLNNAKKYVEKGHKIKVAVRFKGRQMAHPELGKDVILKFIDRLSDISEVEQHPKMEGRSMSAVITPKK